MCNNEFLNVLESLTTYGDKLQTSSNHGPLWIGGFESKRRIFNIFLKIDFDKLEDQCVPKFSLLKFQISKSTISLHNILQLLSAVPF